MATTASVTAVTQDYTFANPGRTVPANEINTLATEIDAGFLSLQQAAFAVATNTDATNNVLPIIRLYEGILGRTPDAGGLAFWAAQERAGANPFTALVAIAQGFANSAEFASLYTGAGAGPQAFLTALYHNVLGRNPDSAGLAFWTGQLGAAPSAVALANVSIGFTNSAEYIANSTNAIQNYLTAAGLAGAYPTVLTGAGGSGGGNPQTFTLTLGQDNLTGSGAGNDILNAPLVFNPGNGAQISALQIGDTINETGSGNVLNAFFAPPGGGAVIAGTTIKGVQTWNITNLSVGNNIAFQAGSLVSGVTTINETNSTGSVTVGAVGASLATAPTTLGVTNTGGTGATALTVMVATAALAGAADALTINVNAAGTSSTAGKGFQVFVGPETGTNGYEAFTVNATGSTSWVQLSTNASGVAATSATSLKVTGSAAVFLGTDASAEWNKLATIDATAATGNVTISGLITVAGGTAGQGILSTDTALTSAKFGTGADTIDLAAVATTAALNAITLDGGAGIDTLIVNNAVATGGVALTQTNFETIGVDLANGTINIANLGSSVTGITFSSLQNGAVVINNAGTAFTVNEGAFGNQAVTVNGPAAGTADVLNFTFAGTGGGFAHTVTGFETVNIANSIGLTTIGALTVTASVGGSVALNLTGSAGFTAGLITLNGNGASITDTNTGLFTFAGTNAQSINAATSGGITMTGVDTGFTGINGASIIGSAASANIIVGSVGNDVLKGGTAGDVFTTNGGGDAITFGAAGKHDVVTLAGFVPLNSIVDAADVSQQGFFGNAPGATSALKAIATGGTSADQSVITGFTAGTSAASDTVQFSTQAWNATGVSTGLVFSDGATHQTGANAVFTQVAAGATLATNASVIELTGQTFANAKAVATALNTTYNLIFSTGVAANKDAHLLVAYNDSTGNAHIADVDVVVGATAATATNGATVAIFASDMVQLTGVSMTSLTANNVVIIA